MSESVRRDFVLGRDGPRSSRLSTMSRVVYRISKQKRESSPQMFARRHLESQKELEYYIHRLHAMYRRFRRQAISRNWIFRFIRFDSSRIQLNCLFF